MNLSAHIKEHAVLGVNSSAADLVAASTISAIDQSVFAATIVDTFLYDTSKDSDGGAWRHRCGHTSWEAETLSGNWLGSAANEAAARAISGATTGSYYYDTTAAAFYTLNAGSGKTATYRGNVRQFPAQVLITVEAARVIIWDLTQAACPMWMVFISTSAYEYIYFAPMVAVAMLNGQMLTSSTSAVSWVDFVGDKSRGSLIRTSGAGYRVTLPISGRNNASAAFRVLDATLPALVTNGANDVAMTVLPNAPVDVCLVGESLVAMADGSLVRLDQVEVGSSVRTLEGESKVIRWMDNGVKDVIEIKFDDGRELICTADHRIRTTVGWVEAGMLTDSHEVIGL